MQELVQMIKDALHLVQADASKQILPLFKTFVSNVMSTPNDPANLVLQFNSFITQVAALLPALNKELQTDIGNALIAWAEKTAGTTAAPPAP